VSRLLLLARREGVAEAALQGFDEFLGIHACPCFASRRAAGREALRGPVRGHKAKGTGFRAGAAPPSGWLGMREPPGDDALESSRARRAPTVSQPVPSHEGRPGAEAHAPSLATAA